MVRMEALKSAIPYHEIERVVKEEGIQRQRKRKLSAELGLLIGIAMHLFQPQSFSQVLWKLMQGIRFLWPGEAPIPATKGAISQVRYAVGARAMVALFHRICQPMAQAETVGAHWKGMLLVGLDGSDQLVADTPANERFFGRHCNDKEIGAFPQAKALYLVELGSHAVIDAGIWPVHRGEKEIGRRMLRSLRSGMLVLWDCGFHSFAMVSQALQSGAQLLTRLPLNVQLEGMQPLSDGSQQVELVSRDHKGRRKKPSILLRLIEYTITDPALPGYGERHRLITSLLDPLRYPALELARLYHERWEVEILIDETDTHQRLAFRPFRSLKPVGVVQEFYGLLIAHYAIRKIMLDAAHLAQIDPDRLSFTNALRLIAAVIPEFELISPELHLDRYHALLQDLARFRLPPRVNRANPRVVKRKESKFDRKRPRHHNWPQPAVPFPEAIALI